MTSTLHMISLPTQIRTNHLSVQAGYASYVIESSYTAGSELHLQSLLSEDTAPHVQDEVCRHVLNRWSDSFTCPPENSSQIASCF